MGKVFPHFLGFRPDCKYQTTRHFEPLKHYSIFESKMIPSLNTQESWPRQVIWQQMQPVLKWVSKRLSKAQFKGEFTLRFGPTHRTKTPSSDCPKWLYDKSKLRAANWTAGAQNTKFGTDHPKSTLLYDVTICNQFAASPSVPQKPFISFCHNLDILLTKKQHSQRHQPKSIIAQFDFATD